jgi:hypothetical protein
VPVGTPPSPRFVVLHHMLTLNRHRGRGTALIHIVLRLRGRQVGFMFSIDLSGVKISLK